MRSEMIMCYIYYTCHYVQLYKALINTVVHIFRLSVVTLVHVFVHYTKDIDKFDTGSIFLAGCSVHCTCITLTADFHFFVNAERTKRHYH
jgi:hypothetical protein